MNRHEDVGLERRGEAPAIARREHTRPVRLATCEGHGVALAEKQLLQPQHDLEVRLVLGKVPARGARVALALRVQRAVPGVEDDPQSARSRCVRGVLLGVVLRPVLQADRPESVLRLHAGRVAEAVGGGLVRGHNGHVAARHRNAGVVEVGLGHAVQSLRQGRRCIGQVLRHRVAPVEIAEPRPASEELVLGAAPAIGARAVVGLVHTAEVEELPRITLRGQALVHAGGKEGGLRVGHGRQVAVVGGRAVPGVAEGALLEFHPGDQQLRGDAAEPGGPVNGVLGSGPDPDQAWRL